MKRQFAEARIDRRKEALDKVRADLANGERPWTKPWNSGNMDGRVQLPERHNGIRYRGINVFMLFTASVMNGFSSPRWITFKQATELGGHIKKGEHGSTVFYTNTIHKTEKDEAGEDVDRDLRFLKSYTVFNIDQTEGLPVQYYQRPEPRFKNDIERLAHVEQFITNTGADIRYGGGRAFYRISDDYIQMPPPEAFRDTFALHSTQLHELSHWTRHPSRLNRSFNQKRFGDEGYQWEEMVAELSSVLLCADLEIVPEPPEENAAYLAGWMKGFEKYPDAYFTGASYAQKSADHLWSYQPPSLHPDAIPSIHTDEPTP